MIFSGRGYKAVNFFGVFREQYEKLIAEAAVPTCGTSRRMTR
jgi:hypothetical protein